MQFKFYRFSVAWTRIYPDATTVNMKGVEYYNKLIDTLIAADIEPIITMYHWDLPQHLQDLGGWTNPLMTKYFTQYADALYEHFGDRVKRWVTFNEPYIQCVFGYAWNYHAPLISASGVGEYLCGHHQVLAHAAAYHLYKDKYFEEQQGQVGITVDSNFYFPANDDVTQEDVDNAINFKMGWFTHAIFSEEGGYPQVMVDRIALKSDNEGRPWSRLPTMTDEMKNSIRGTADFLGLNYYSSSYMTPGLKDGVSWSDDAGMNTYSNRSSWPDGLYGLLNWIKDNYNNPTLLITENGRSDDGTSLEDDVRIEFVQAHLAAVSDAIADGCNVVGYAVWSFIDNFEWASGYTSKFGIYSIDFEDPDLERVPKKSVEFFKQVTADRFFDYEVQEEEVYTFPESFKFGSASSAYQIEGAWDADGKSPSIWDTLVHERNEFVADGTTGDVAANSYSDYAKDVAALKDVGVSSFAI